MYLHQITTHVVTSTCRCQNLKSVQQFHAPMSTNTDVVLSFLVFSMQQIWNVLGLMPSGRLVDVLLLDQILIGRTIIVVTFIRRKALLNPLFLVAGGFFIFER